MRKFISSFLLVKVALLAMLPFLVPAPSLAQSATPVSGLLTGSQCLVVPTAGMGVVAISVKNFGTAWSGTINPLVQTGQDTFDATTVTTSLSTVSQSSITGNGTFYANVGGNSNFELCGGTITNTASVRMQAVPLSARGSGLGTGNGATGAFVSTTAELFVSSKCGSTTTCVTGTTDESTAIQALVTSSGCKGSGGCYIVDDMCGIQTWSVQPFQGASANVLSGVFIFKSSCPSGNPHIVSVDGMSTVLVPSGMWLVGMGTSQAATTPQYGATGNTLIGGSYIRACNPVVYPCVNGGFQIQNGTVASTGTPASNLSLVTMTAAPFTAASVNTLNTLQQYRMVHIVGATGAPTNNAAWVVNDVVQATSPQSFHVAVTTGFAQCLATCGKAYLDTPLMNVGAGTGSGSFGTRIINLTLDCSYMSGCSSWVQGAGQEKVGINDVDAWNATVYGGRIDESCAYNGVGSCAGATNSGDYGPWSFNPQAITCGNTTCGCQGGSGVQITVSSFTGTTGTLTFTTTTNVFQVGDLVQLSGFTAGNVGLNGQVVTVLAAGLNSTHFEATVTGSGFASGAGIAMGGGQSCSSFTLGTPGTVVLGAKMSCGAGQQNATIANLDGFDPCVNGNFHSILLTGTSGSQGSGRMKGHLTATFADKSNNGLPTPEFWGGTAAGQVWGQGGVTGTPGTIGACVGIYGTHAVFDHVHTEYCGTGISVGGDPNRTATFYYVYTAPAASPQARTGGFSVDGGFGSVCGSGTSCSPGNSMEIEIGSSVTDANMIGDIDIRNMDVLNGNAGKALVDNVYNRTCTTYGGAPGTDWVLSYKVSHVATSAQTNPGEMNLNVPSITSTCTNLPHFTGNNFSIPLVANTSIAAFGEPVKWSGTANQVVPTVTTDTGAGVVVGVAFNSATSTNYTSVVTTGIVTMVVGTSATCTAIGLFVIVDTTTPGDIKCTGTYTAGTVIGTAMQTGATAGNTINVLVGLR